MRRRAAVILAWMLSACDLSALAVFDGGSRDSGAIEVPDSAVGDSGLADAAVEDAGDARVADANREDAADAGPADSDLADSALMDSGLMDSGLIDSGLIDSGLIDSGLIDSGFVDSGLVDSGLVDSGLVDSGLADAGRDAGLDAGSDGAVADTGTFPDAAPADTGAPDARPPDASTISLGENITADINNVTADTSVRFDFPTLNFGASPQLRAQNDTPETTLVRFEVAGALPSTATITAARLHIWTSGGGRTTATVQIFTVLEAWTEGTEDFQPGIANYLDRTATESWTTPGAGFGSISTASIAAFNPSLDRREWTIALPPQLIRAWRDHPTTNFGVALAITELTNDGATFYSSTNSELDERPLLEVDYLY